jgi:hypothetical protein
MALMYPLPSSISVRNLFASLLDKELIIEKGLPLEIKPAPPVQVAAYVADDGTIAACCIADLDFAARIAAAMTLIPHNLVEESLKNRKLVDVLQENFNEIMNVATILFYMASTPHVKLKKVYQTVEGLPRDIVILSKKPAARLDLNIQVPNYGPGRVSLLVNKRKK